MKHQTRKTISRYDRNQLLQAIQHTVTAQPYATPRLTSELVPKASWEHISVGGGFVSRLALCWQ